MLSPTTCRNLPIKQSQHANNLLVQGSYFLARSSDSQIDSNSASLSFSQVSTENNLKNIIFFTLKVQRIMHKPWPCSFGLTTGHIYVQKEWEAKRREKAIEFGLLVLDNGKWRGRKWAFGRSFHESQKDRKEIRLLLCTQPQLCRASLNQLAIGNVFLTLACNT